MLRGTKGKNDRGVFLGCASHTSVYAGFSDTSVFTATRVVVLLVAANVTVLHTKALIMNSLCSVRGDLSD